MATELPLVEELPGTPDPEAAFLSLSRLPHCLFLDSALRDPQLGRYSFVSADPFAFLQWKLSDHLLERMEQQLAPYQADSVAGLPPFQGGAAALLAYDLHRSLETIPQPRYDEFELPALAMGLYDVVVAYDHLTNRTWLISQGFPESDAQQRQARASARLAYFKHILSYEAAREASVRWDRCVHVPSEQLAPQYPLVGLEGLTSSFSKDGFLSAVEQVREYIHAGDVFQVNLSQRLLYPVRDDPVSLYLRLRRRNPAPFAGYFDLGSAQIVSASPERFVRTIQGQVETRPIKGTRQRTARPEADLYAGDELQQSEKDRAENVMIVDLLRNDLSRVCRPESIRVSQLCRLETFPFVQHLVSAVCGTLTPGQGAIDLIRASFPGGSITGAPKVRAMEIIAELEPTARGAYCGSLGYLGFDGTLDLNILIRSITASRGWWQLPVGAGIVSQSIPTQEYEETLHKATGLLRALKR
jgi:para-aminobenzoate synthetase component 1